MEAMKDSIWPIFSHMISHDSDSLDDQHKFCPKGDDSWCKYWSDRENYSEKNRLPAVFADLLKPVFVDLTKDELLKRCLLGLTQNQNKALNNILWGPKANLLA